MNGRGGFEYRERTRLGGCAERPHGRNAVRWLILFVLLWLMVTVSRRIWAQTLPPRRVVVVLVPGLRADDLTSPLVPALQRLRAEGAAGWMVCRAARTTDRALLRPDGRDTSESLALTLGSGSRALAGEGKRKKEKGERNAYTALNSYETADSVDALRTLNRNVDHVVSIGALGDAIHAQGWQTAVLGGADARVLDDSGRLLAMDSRGQIDIMPLSLRPNRAAPLAPYGVQDDVDGMARTLRGLHSRVAFVVVVFGDLARADEYGPLCLPAQRDAHRANALRELNALLEQVRQDASAVSQSDVSPASVLMPSADTPPIIAHSLADDTHSAFNAPPHTTGSNSLPTLLYVLSGAPAESSDRTDRIAPILLWGKGIPAGVLTSPSTRLPGVVVNTDFLPSVAADLGLTTPRAAIGRAFQTLPSPAPTTAAWRAQHDRLLLSEHLKDVYGGLPTFQAVLVLLAFWTHRIGRRQWVLAFAAAIVTLPLGMLLLPILPFAAGSVWKAGLALVLWTLLFATVAGYSGHSHTDHAPLRARSLLNALFGVLLAVLMLDLVTGSRLLRGAWMSYSVMETARFYGIGNEYMGAAIGAACILVGVRGQGQGSRQRFTQLLSSVFCLLLVFILGYNRYGAKVGAIPSAGCALGVVLLVLWRGRLRGRDVGLALLGSLLLLGALGWLDARHGIGEQSHLARAVGSGVGGVWQIARRKLLLEGYLLTHSVWSAALVSASGVFWLLTKPGRQKADGPQFIAEGDGDAADKSRRAVISGLVTGAVVSLLCNDSGITASALIMLFGCAWLLSTQTVSLSSVSLDGVSSDSVKLESVSRNGSP